ncbi:hypothetical protein BH23CHL8_BH23CHL8_20980 [soil metagenome]
MNDRPATKRDASVSDAEREGDSSLTDVTSRIADAVVDASADASERLSGVAGTAGEAFRDVDSQLRRSSDQTLAVVGAMSVGVALGLLAGGSNRLLVAAALIPAALVAGIAAERMDRASARAGEPVH